MEEDIDGVRLPRPARAGLAMTSCNFEGKLKVVKGVLAS